MLKMDRQRVVAELLRAVQVATQKKDPAATVAGLKEITRIGGLRDGDSRS
jgi:hypothetical protein